MSLSSLSVTQCDPVGLVDWMAVAPIAIVAGCALLLLCINLIVQPNGTRQKFSTALCVLSCVIAASFATVQEMFHDRMLGCLLYVDTFTVIFYFLILGGAAMTFLLNDGQQESQGIRPSIDFDVLTLLAVCGGMVMVSTSHLLVLFLGFELLSVCVYVLSGAALKQKASAEAALKYFILGAFSSAFLLYGMALIYAATGSMDLGVIASAISLSSPLLLVGIGLLVFGFGFKVGAVPFHFWAPDVYQGAPTGVTTFMAIVVKAAAFGSFFRVMFMAFERLRPEWSALIWAISVVTMTLGNLLALRQKSVKRMLAYSSIAHAGYILIGLVAAQKAGGGAALFYLVAYSLMTVISFGVVLLATAGTNFQYDKDDLQSMKGMGWTHPFLSLCMVIALLSLGGVPPTAGFAGKLFLFRAAVESGYVGLAVIAALNSVVSLFYYLRVIMVMYFSGDQSTVPNPPFESVLGARVAISLATVGTLIAGIYASPLFQITTKAVTALHVD